MNPISPQLLLSGLYFIIATVRNLGHRPFVFSSIYQGKHGAEGSSTHLPRVYRDTQWTSRADSQVFQWVVTQYPSLSHCPFIVNTSFLTKSPKWEVILNQHDPKIPQWSRETAATLSGSACNTQKNEVSPPLPLSIEKTLRISSSSWFWKFVRQTPKNLVWL